MVGSLKSLSVCPSLSSPSSTLWAGNFGFEEEEELVVVVAACEVEGDVGGMVAPNSCWCRIVLLASICSCVIVVVVAAAAGQGGIKVDFSGRVIECGGCRQKGLRRDGGRVGTVERRYRTKRACFDLLTGALCSLTEAVHSRRPDCCWCPLYPAGSKLVPADHY